MRANAADRLCRLLQLGLACFTLMAAIQICAATVVVEIDPARGLGSLLRLYRPSVMMSFADRDAIDAFLALPGPLGTVRLTLEPLIMDSKSLPEYLERLDCEAAGLRRLTVRGAEIVITIARTPRWLARTQNESLAGRYGFTHWQAAPPKDYDAFADFIYETVRIINGRYGISPWYEFWNEPDSGAFWTGTQEELLRAETDRLGLDRVVVFAGWRTDLDVLLPGCDVFCLPSLWETFGYVLLETMAARLPIVATRVDGIPEVTGEGQCALLVPPADEGALAAGLIALLKDGAQRAALAAAGRARVEREYTLARMIGRIEDLYQELAERVSARG